MIYEIDYDNRCSEEISEEIYEYIETAIKATLSEYEFEVGYQLSISFVDEEEIKSLNSQYRNVDRVTDVLSFPMEDTDERGVEILGDVVICTKRAREQATELGHELKRELSYLSVHSILHLLGMDHENDDDKCEMRLVEKAIMKKLGIFK